MKQFIQSTMVDGKKVRQPAHVAQPVSLVHLHNDIPEPERTTEHPKASLLKPGEEQDSVTQAGM